MKADFRQDINRGFAFSRFLIITKHYLEGCALQCWSPDIRIIRNPDIFGPFDRPKIDAPNSDTRIVKKTLFLEHFFMIFFCFYIYFFWELSFFQFLYSFCSRIAAKNEEKILLRKIVRMMRNIMMKMMKIMTI